MSRAFHFSIRSILAFTAVVAVVMFLGRTVGPGNVGFLIALTLPIVLVIRWPHVGFAVGVLTAWASVFIGCYIEKRLGVCFAANARVDAVFLPTWMLFGWLVSAIYLLPIYLLRLACGYWWKISVTATEHGTARGPRRGRR